MVVESPACMTSGRRTGTPMPFLLASACLWAARPPRYTNRKDLPRLSVILHAFLLSSRAQTGYMPELIDRHRAVLPAWMALYYEHPLELVNGSGSRVTDADGHTYLDFFCGILTNMLGYDIPEV